LVNISTSLSFANRHVASITVNRSKRKFFYGRRRKELFISRKELQEMRKEIADLKQKTESQQKKIQLLKEAIVTGKKNGYVS